MQIVICQIQIMEIIMKNIKTLSLSLCMIGIASTSMAHEYENKCQNIQVPIYDTNAVDDALAGAVIGGILGKVATKKDQGAAAGAVIGGIIGAESSKKKIKGYRTEQKCEQVPLAPHSHQSNTWTDPDTKKPIIIEQPKPPRQTREDPEQAKIHRNTTEMQKSLNYFGFNVGSADGIMGTKTRNGIMEYQEYAGLNKTGVLSNFDTSVLKDCVKTSRQIDENSLYAKRNTLQKCVKDAYPHTTINEPVGDKKTSLSDRQIENLWALRNYQNSTDESSSITTRRISSIDKVLSNNPTKGRIDKNKDITLNEVIRNPLELSFNDNAKGYVNSANKVIVRSSLTNSGNMYHSIDFINEQINAVDFVIKINKLNSEETENLSNVLDTYMKWAETAQENNIQQDIERFIDCIPDCNYSDRSNENRIPTKFNLKVTDSGDTYLMIEQKDKDVVYLENYTVDVLSAYINYTRDLHEKNNSNELSKEELDKLFQ